jgi:hypothetical protein
VYHEATGIAIVNVLGGTGGYQYTWNTSPATNTQIAKQLKAGLYTVYVKDENGCTSNSSIAINDSLTDINSTLLSKVYPIPAVNQFTVEYNSNSNLVNSISVISYDGKSIFNSIFLDDLSVNGFKIDCSVWNRGMYYVILKDKNDLILYSKPVILVR